MRMKILPKKKVIHTVPERVNLTRKDHHHQKSKYIQILQNLDSQKRNIYYLQMAWIFFFSKKYISNNFLRNFITEESNLIIIPNH